MEKIPFMDLALQIKSLQPELRQSIDQIIESCAFIQGSELERFNKNFLQVHGGLFGVGCANGTSAITVALRALGIGPGDEVLVPNHTFFGTVEPVVEVGATPVLLEIDEEFGQIDLQAAHKKITDKTKAIIPVHLYGLPEPMDQVMEFARIHRLQVIEDCAQAVLAKWDDQAVGTFGQLGTFSFYPGKNLGAFGDAGFILTQDNKLFEFIEKYVNHGRLDKYKHEIFAGNFRMDGLQAAVLNVKLTKLKEWTQRRRELKEAFDEQLIPTGFKTLKPRPQASPVYHLYVVQVSNRDQVMAHFLEQGVGCGIHYPIPLNCQPAFASLGYKKGQFPVSERLSERILSLPFFPEMTPEQMQTVVTEFLRVARP